MMINNIPHEFEFLSNIRKKVTFKENKIYFSFDSVLFYWLGFFATIILPFTIYIIFRGYINNYHLEVIKKYDDIAINFVSIYCLVSLAFCSIISWLVEFNSVIDFTDNSFYKQIKILFIELKLQTINLNEIKYITNNCIVANNIFSPSGINKHGYYEGKRKAEGNGKTHQIQKYYVSFLLNNGKLINFIDLGIFEEDYLATIKLADAMADFWHIHLLKCRDDCSLKVMKDNLSNITCIEEEIKPFSEGLFILYMILGIILSFFIPVGISFLLYR